MRSISKLRTALRFGLLAAALALVAALALAGSLPVVSALAKLLLAGLAVGAALWLSWRLARKLLWSVGRRLAFSYFLIGVLPIPMVLLLVLLSGYLLAGYFLGHLYRDAVSGLQTEVELAADDRLADWRRGGPRVASEAESGMVFAYYRTGKRVGGSELLPLEWPSWLAGGRTEAKLGERERPVSYAGLPDGQVGLAAAAGDGDLGVAAARPDRLEDLLTARSEVWVELLRAEDPRHESRIRLQLGGREFALLPLLAKRSHETRAEYFGATEELPFWQRPFLWWGEIGGPLRDLGTGREVSSYMVASLNGNLRTVYRHLFSSSAEVDTAVWVGMIALTGILSSLYGLAILMAAFVIFSLSRAVNRLSRATEAVRGGDFSVRIPVRRRDQVGALQSSFNEMTANLERSVQAVAQKESLENELAIARDLQQSLLPADLPKSESVDFATLFEPSAAIGGDYFDILRLDDDRLVVVIADVSGHGLPTGLRMAMLKAALVILVEERKQPVEIFQRLSSMVRSEQGRRLFVTSTLGVVDFRRGAVELTNAGHPPTYLVREGEVRELLLLGNPLGALGEEYGQLELRLESGDVLVWLSDGLIEATDERGEPFGYERVEAALRGRAASASEVRNRLLEAVGRHTDGRPGADDKTLVAMRWAGAPVETAGAAAGEAADQEPLAVVSASSPRKA